MARMYSRKKGKSGSKNPIKKAKSSWIDFSSKEIEQLIIKLAKAGNTPSKIGLMLRDSYGVPSVQNVANKKILKILRENKLNPEVPEDLNSLIKRESIIMKHLEINKKDMVSKRGFQLTSSKIRRLMKYYKKEGILENDWTYEKGKVY
ncbi:MAG: 30S ribosomal protein S15 [Candidatus Nanoarchaeia archaeon]|nr:30S ribosomal protein S15 [Candidatus Nanoarchaeia archaeon]|tara:strand:+ start:470 stop:913 length:444 start_codon:yes stop_codon:yes gene_type:complete